MYRMPHKRNSLCLIYRQRPPTQRNAVRLDVGDAEVPDTESGRQNGALQRAAPRHGLIRVQRGARLLFEDLVDQFLYGWNACGAADNLNSINIIQFQF